MLEYKNEQIEQLLVDEKLMEITKKMLEMRQKLKSVNSRFDFVKNELIDQHEYVIKLTKIKKTLEEQESILKNEIINIAKKVLARKFEREIPTNISNDEIMIEANLENETNLEKFQKDKVNSMLKLKDEIDYMKDYEEYQSKKLSELQKIKDLILKFSTIDMKENQD